MLFGLWESKSSNARTQQRRPIGLEELSPRIMLSGTGSGDPDPILPPPPDPPPAIPSNP